MRDQDVDNYMLYPRSWELREYTKHCSCCDNGIGLQEKYYEIPVGNRVEAWCEECTEDHITYAKYDTECAICGRTIHEDEEALFTDDAVGICLDCTEEMGTLHSD